MNRIAYLRSKTQINLKIDLKSFKTVIYDTALVLFHIFPHDSHTMSMRKIKTMRLDVDVIADIEKMAREQNRNFSNMVETILKRVVEPGK